MPYGVEGLLDIHKRKDGRTKEAVLLDTCNDPKNLVVHVDTGSKSGLGRWDEVMGVKVDVESPGQHLLEKFGNR